MHGRSGNKGPSQRQLRVNELIRHEMAELLRRVELQDEALSGQFITVSEVRTSPDLRHATVFVAPLGGGDPAAIVEGLTRCKRFLRGELGHRLTTKFTPELHFQPDETFDEATRINTILKSGDVARDLAKDHDGDDDGAQT